MPCRVSLGGGGDGGGGEAYWRATCIRCIQSRSKYSLNTYPFFECASKLHSTGRCALRMCMHGHNPKTALAHGYFMHKFFLAYSPYLQQACMLVRSALSNPHWSLAGGAQPTDDDLHRQLSNFSSTDPPPYYQTRGLSCFPGAYRWQAQLGS